MLNETLFASLSHAREALTIWKDDYNTVQAAPAALDYLPAAIYAKISVPGMQRDGTLRYIEGSRARPLTEPTGLKRSQDSPHQQMRQGAVLPCSA